MVSIENLSFKYSHKNELFSGLNLQLVAGHIYGLLGKNGAGKSTLLKNMVGLAFPASGSCSINGADVSKRPASILSDLYFLAEDIFVPPLSPLAFAKRTGCFYPKFSNAEFVSHLNALDVDPRAAMDKVSFGQQKKAMAAFGLATNTSLLIMDEPTNGLDIPSKAQFRKLIASALTDSRCIIISTHQVRDLDSLIDSLVVLHNGEIMINKSLDEITNGLLFGTYRDTAGLPVLFEEEGVHGKKAVIKNTTGRMSKTDLELLFNAIVSGNQSILNTLNHKK